MAEIIRAASAGTMESSDAYVEIEPSDKGLELTVESVVEAQFGEEIRNSAMEVLEACGIESGKVRVVDQGALDLVIRARLETAVRRGTEA